MRHFTRFPGRSECLISGRALSPSERIQRMVVAYYDRGLQPKTAVLSEIALFAALSEAEIQVLAQRAVERRFAPDEILFWEGEACAGVFLIVQGSVKIF